MEVESITNKIANSFLSIPFDNIYMRIRRALSWSVSNSHEGGLISLLSALITYNKHTINRI